MGGRLTRRHDRACAAIRRTGCGVCADNQVVRARSAGLPHGACVQNHIPLKERAVHNFVAACPTVPAKRLCPKTRSLVRQRGDQSRSGKTEVQEPTLSRVSKQGRHAHATSTWPSWKMRCTASGSSSPVESCDSSLPTPGAKSPTICAPSLFCASLAATVVALTRNDSSGPVTEGGTSSSKDK